jgi:hypothetical protein
LDKRETDQDPFLFPLVERETVLALHLAVPEKRCGLTLILAFFDRCGNSWLAFSATGSASPQFQRERRSPYLYLFAPRRPRKIARSRSLYRSLGQ